MQRCLFPRLDDNRHAHRRIASHTPLLLTLYMMFRF